MSRLNKSTRFNRKSYLANQLSMTCATVLIYVLAISGNMLEGTPNNLINLTVIVLLPTITVLALFTSTISALNRLHDLNLNGWYCLLILFPYLNIFFVLMLFFRKSWPEPNQWGSPTNDLEWLVTKDDPSERLQSSRVNKPSGVPVAIKTSNDSRISKNIIIGISIVVLVFATSSIMIGVLDTKNDNSPTSSISTSGVEYNSTQHTFKALFTDQPEVANETLDINGFEVPNTLHISEDGNYAYMVQVTDYPAEFDMSDTRARLEGGANGMARTYTNGAIISSNFSQFGAYQSLDSVITGQFEGAEVELRSKLFLVGQKLYTVGVLGYDNYPNLNTNYQKFLDSFMLL